MAAMYSQAQANLKSTRLLLSLSQAEPRFSRLIPSPEQAARDPLVGAIFENLVVGEIIKAQANKGNRPENYFFRDSNAAEVDLLIPGGSSFDAVEIKSAETYRQSLLKSPNRIESLTPEVASRYLIYRGERRSFSNGIKALPYEEAALVA